MLDDVQANAVAIIIVGLVLIGFAFLVVVNPHPSPMSNYIHISDHIDVMVNGKVVGAQHFIIR